MEKTKLAVIELPVEQLHPHPQNPRKDLGDLEELADSIKEIGIQQNLTVIPYVDEAGKEVDDQFTVIMGHRRLAAAKQAGLATIPCCIRWEMAPAEQIALMLCENMQRNELTPQEEGLAFQQLKLDFGWTVDQISQRTGFSQTKVRSRLVIASLDQKKVKAKMSKQINLGDFVALGKIKDEKKRNELLELVGRSSFSAYYQRALKEEQKQEFTNKLLEVPFLKNAKIIELYQTQGYADEYKLIAKIDIPPKREITPDFVDKMPAIPEGQKKHFIYIDLYSEVVGFYQKVKKEPPRTEAKKQKEETKRRIAMAWTTLEGAWRIAYEIRKNFVKNIPYHTSEQKLLVLQGALFARLGVSTTPTGRVYEAVKDILEIRYAAGGYIPNTERYQAIINKLPNMDKKHMPEIIYSLFNDSDKYIQCGWIPRDWPKWRERSETRCLYAWLEALGYEISPEEQSLIDGTHEVFQREKNWNKHLQELSRRNQS